MSAWGSRDNVFVTIKGTAASLANVNTTIGSAVVTNTMGNATAFTTNINAGDYITLAGNKFQVSKVDSDTQITLTDVMPTKGNVNAFVQQGPKYVSNVGGAKSPRYANIVNIRRVFGVDRDEIANAHAAASANANATAHTGWVDVLQFQHQGTTRTKTEVLVAMSKNFNANATGNLHATNDASDNATYPQTRNEGGLGPNN